MAEALNTLAYAGTKKAEITGVLVATWGKKTQGKTTPCKSRDGIESQPQSAICDLRKGRDWREILFEKCPISRIGSLAKQKLPAYLPLPACFLTASFSLCKLHRLIMMRNDRWIGRPLTPFDVGKHGELISGLC